MPKILAFSGSSRQTSFNTMLVSIAASAAREEGADVTVINLGDYPMPIYNADLEEKHGLPQSVL
jgi:NAD(P)H-dependent FMN reductase